MRNTKKRIKRNKRRTRKYSSSLTGGSNTSSVSSSGSKGSLFQRGLHKVAKRTGFAGNSRDRTRMHFPGVKLPTSTEFHSNIERQVTGVNPSSDTNRQPKTFEVSTMEPAIQYELPRKEGEGGGLRPEDRPLELQLRTSEAGEDIQDLGEDIQDLTRSTREEENSGRGNSEEGNPLQPQPPPENSELNQEGTTKKQGVNVTTGSSNTVINPPSPDNQEKSMSAMQNYYKTLNTKDKLRVKEILKHLCTNLENLDNETSGAATSETGAPIIETGAPISENGAPTSKTGPETIVFSAEKPKPNSMFRRVKKRVTKSFSRKKKNGPEAQEETRRRGEEEGATTAQEETSRGGDEEGATTAQVETSRGGDEGEASAAEEEETGSPFGASAVTRSTEKLGGKKKRRHTFVRRKKKGKKRKKRTKTKKRLHKKR